VFKRNIKVKNNKFVILFEAYQTLNMSIIFSQYSNIDSLNYEKVFLKTKV